MTAGRQVCHVVKLLTLDFCLSIGGISLFLLWFSYRYEGDWNPARFALPPGSIECAHPGF